MALLDEHFLPLKGIPKALDLINAEYGSMDAYLRNALGLTDKDFEILRERYLCLEVQVIETELLKELVANSYEIVRTKKKK